MGLLVCWMTMRDNFKSIYKFSNHDNEQRLSCSESMKKQQRTLEMGADMRAYLHAKLSRELSDLNENQNF